MAFLQLPALPEIVGSTTNKTAMAFLNILETGYKNSSSTLTIFPRVIDFKDNAQMISYSHCKF
jgi:hypothetical protein